MQLLLPLQATLQHTSTLDFPFHTISGLINTFFHAQTLLVLADTNIYIFFASLLSGSLTAAVCLLAFNIGIGNTSFTLYLQ